MSEWSHLTLASEGRLTLFPGEPARRLAVRTLARVLGRSLALFFVADDHIHLVVRATGQSATRQGQALLFALRPLVSVALAPPRLKAVESRDHMQSLLPYVLNQGAHHRIPGHPALSTGSCLQDIIGARHLEGLDLQLGEALPRFKITDVLRLVGLPGRAIEPMDDMQMRYLGPTALIDAVMNAACAGPKLEGREALAVSVRVATAHLAREARIPQQRIAECFGISGRALRYLGATPPPEALMRAARIRLALERAVAESPVLLAEEPGGYGESLLLEP